MEIIANAVQEIAPNQNALFTDTVVDGCDIISHRVGSGIVKLHALNNRCFTRFKITFGGNIAVPTEETPGAISLAISVDGEPEASTTMIVTPAAVEEYFNVGTSTYLYVRRNCCATIGIRNTSTLPVNLQNANLIVTVG